jgi:hypothetical protein
MLNWSRHASFRKDVKSDRQEHTIAARHQLSRFHSIAEIRLPNLSPNTITPPMQAKKNPTEGRYNLCSKTSSKGTIVDSTTKLRKNHIPP